MAELLIFIENRIDLSRDAEASGALPKLGDVTEVRADGFLWGREESKAVWVAEGRDPDEWSGKTVVVKVPGLSATMLRDKLVRSHQRLMTPQDAEYDPSVPVDQQHKVVHHYVWRVNLRHLMPVHETTALPDCDITVTRGQLYRHLDHKVSRAMFLGTSKDGQGSARRGDQLRERP